MLQLFFGLVAVLLIWLTVGAMVAKKGRRDGLGFQVLAVFAFLGGGFAGAVAAVFVVDPETTNLALAALVHFALPFVTGGACAGAVIWWVSQLRLSKATSRRTKEAADYNPFDDGSAKSSEPPVLPPL